MEDTVRQMRLVPLLDAAPGHGKDPGDPGFTDADLDTARELAEFHRLLASELEPRSQLRGLVLRCAGHWSRLGAIPRNGLAEARAPGRHDGRRSSDPVWPPDPRSPAVLRSSEAERPEHV